MRRVEAERRVDSCCFRSEGSWIWVVLLGEIGEVDGG